MLQTKTNPLDGFKILIIGTKIVRFYSINNFYIFAYTLQSVCRKLN